MKLFVAVLLALGTVGKYFFFFFEKMFNKNTLDAQFKCPPKDGQYEDSRQCDKFYQCDDGIAKEKICPDGLVFDPTIRKINKCDQPFNVDCGDRTELRKYFSFCKERKWLI